MATELSVKIINFLCFFPNSLKLQNFRQFRDQFCLIRPSMDLLTGMTPPSVSFMPRSGSRRLVSSFHKKQQSSFFDSFSSSSSKPLLSQSDPDKEETILPVKPPNFPSQRKLSVTDLPLPETNLCSFSQSVLNGKLINYPFRQNLVLMIEQDKHKS